MMATLNSPPPFPVVTVKSALNSRSLKQPRQQPNAALQNEAVVLMSSTARKPSIESQPLKLPDLVVKSAPAVIRKKSKNYIYKYKLLPGNNVRVLLGAIRRRPWWHPTTSQDSDDPNNLPTFLWEMYRNPKRYDGSYQNVILNHLQNNNCLVAKKGLYFCIKNYCQEKSIDPLSVIPRTYFISMGSNSNELTEFMEYNDRCRATKQVAAAAVRPVALRAQVAAAAAADSENNNIASTSDNRPPSSSASAVVAVPAAATSPSAASASALPEEVDKAASDRSDEVIWIMKPASKTNRGFGIKVVQGVKEVMEIVNGRTSSAQGDDDDSNDGSVVASKDNRTMSRKHVAPNNNNSNSNSSSNNNNGSVSNSSNGNSGAAGSNSSSAVTNNTERLAALGRDARKKARREGWIVQEYMTRPLLVSGRKFDIRCYVLITSTQPRGIRGYFYRDAYVRTSCKKYSLDALSDREIHLTNDAVQKYAKSYGKFENGNKLSFAEWQAVIDKDYPTAPRDIVMSKIMPEIKRITSLSLAAAAASGIGDTDISKSFELLGYDYMVDEDFQPKLIEINSNPCLEFASPLLEEIISSLIENVVRVGIDSVCPPPAPGHRSKACEAAIASIEAQENKFELLYH